jgi:hypothetical protein
MEMDDGPVSGRASGGGPRGADAVPQQRLVRVFVSYAHESAGHKEKVRTLAEILRAAGIDAKMDQWLEEHRRDWDALVRYHIHQSDFVLVIASPAYRRVGDGNAASDDHPGVQAEAAQLRDLLFEDRQEWTGRILPVLLPDYPSKQFIPRFLLPNIGQYYEVPEISQDGVTELLLALRGQARHTAPRLGSALGSPRASAVRSDPTARLSTLSRRVAHEAGGFLDADPAAPSSLRDLYVPRVDVEDRLRSRCAKGSITVVTGEAGVGKTSLLWHVAGDLDTAGRSWLFLRAIDLVPEADVLGRPATVTPADLDDALATDGGRPAVLLVDTVDLLLRSELVPPVLLDLFTLPTRHGVALVLTCRDREYAVLRRLHEDFPHEKIPLEPYSKTEVGVAVERHARHFCKGTPADPRQVSDTVLRAVARGLPLVEIVHRPLTLRLLFETQHHFWQHWPASASGSDGGIDPELDVTDLYDRYWQLRIGADRRIGAESAKDLNASVSAFLVAVTMLALGRPSVLRRTVDGELSKALGAGGCLGAGLDALVRRGVLLGADRGELEFFHQTLFEYAAGRALLAAGTRALEALADRLWRYPSDLFLAAVAQQLLVFACSSQTDAYRVDGLFADLLSTGEPAAEQLAMAAYAQARHRGPATVAAGQQLLRTATPGLVGRFLTYLPRVRHDDESVLADLAIVWELQDSNRAQVLESFAVCAALSPSRVRAFIEEKEIDWLGWFAELPPNEARLRRNAVLNLVRAVGMVDRSLTGDQLSTVASVVVRDAKTQDALASVLTVAAQVLDTEAELAPLLRIVPATARATDSGAGPLRQALAGIQRKIWLDQGASVETLTDELLAGSDESADRAANIRKAQWWALAELAQSAGHAQVEALLEKLLACRNPLDQSDIADHVLRRLIEGTHRDPVPGADPPATSSATAVARRECARRLAELPRPMRDPDGARSPALVCLTAFDHAALPAAELATTLREAGVGTDSVAWSRSDGLAGLAVQAALGGHPDAGKALREWVDNPSQKKSQPGRGASEVRRILGYRLRRSVGRHPEALALLIDEAKKSQDGTFLLAAIDERPMQSRPIPPEYVEDISTVANLLLEHRDPVVRRSGYGIHARLVREPQAPAITAASLLRGLAERRIDTANAAFTMLEAILDQRSEELMPAGVFAPIERELARLSDPAVAPSPEAAGLAARCLRVLYCRSAPLNDKSTRRAMVRRARELVLAAHAPEDLAPFGFLMARVADVDPRAAGDLLVEASRTVDRFTGPENSWKRRRAHRWRPAIIAVISRLTFTDWRNVLERLATLDESHFSQAIDVSIHHRAELVEPVLEPILSAVQATPRVMAEYRGSLQRKQRRFGGAENWISVLDLWWSLPVATAGLEVRAWSG